MVHDINVTTSSTLLIIIIIGPQVWRLLHTRMLQIILIHDLVVIMSPLNIEYIMKEALDGFKGTVSIGGSTISNVRFVDDIDLLASLPDELNKMTGRECCPNGDGNQLEEK